MAHSNGTVADLLRPLTNWGSQIQPTGPTSRYVPPPGEYDRRYRQGSYVLCQLLHTLRPNKLIVIKFLLFCSVSAC